jgi:hypothetical protein
MLMAVSLLGSGCFGDGATEISEEHREYAAAFCEARVRFNRSGDKITDPMDTLENSSLPEIRRTTAVRVLETLLDASQTYGRTLESLSPPAGDDAFESAQLKFHASIQDQLRLAIVGAESAETNEELNKALGRYGAWSREQPRAASEAFNEATDELRQAIINTPECDRIWVGS